MADEYKIVRSPELKDEELPDIHYHNDIDQPAIDTSQIVSGSIAHNTLTGVTSDQHHAKLHAAAHLAGGSDPFTGANILTPNEISIALLEPALSLQNLGGAVTDAQVPNTITLTNITQITNRSHTNLSDIGTNTHTQIDTALARFLMTSVTLAAGATALAITSDTVKVTGDALGNTIATITGGLSGQRLTLIFVDNLVTITDTAATTANTVNLSAAFTSAANTTLTLVFDNNKWFEVSRSVN